MNSKHSNQTRLQVECLDNRVLPDAQPGVDILIVPPQELPKMTHRPSCDICGKPSS